MTTKQGYHPVKRFGKTSYLYLIGNLKKKQSLFAKRRL